MTTDLLVIYAALAELSDAELHALIAASNGAPPVTYGLLVWIEGACDWELNRRIGRDYDRLPPEVAIGSYEDAVSIDAAMAMRARFAQDSHAVLALFDALVELLIGDMRQYWQRSTLLLARFRPPDIRALLTSGIPASAAALSGDHDSGEGLGRPGAAKPLPEAAVFFRAAARCRIAPWTSTWRAIMTNVPLHRHYRNRLLVPVALLVCLALLAVLAINTLDGVLVEPMSAFILGVILGAMTGVCFAVRQRWRLYLASRT